MNPIDPFAYVGSDDPPDTLGFEEFQEDLTEESDSDFSEPKAKWMKRNLVSKRKGKSSTPKTPAAHTSPAERSSIALASALSTPRQLRDRTKLKQKKQQDSLKKYKKEQELKGYFSKSKRRSFRGNRQRIPTLKELEQYTYEDLSPSDSDEKMGGVSQSRMPKKGSPKETPFSKARPKEVNVSTVDLTGEKDLSPEEVTEEEVETILQEEEGQDGKRRPLSSSLSSLKVSKLSSKPRPARKKNPAKKPECWDCSVCTFKHEGLAAAEYLTCQMCGNNRR